MLLTQHRTDREDSLQFPTNPILGHRIGNGSKWSFFPLAVVIVPTVNDGPCQGRLKALAVT